MCHYVTTFKPVALVVPQVHHVVFIRVGTMDTFCYHNVILFCNINVYDNISNYLETHQFIDLKKKADSVFG